MILGDSKTNEVSRSLAPSGPAIDVAEVDPVARESTLPAYEETDEAADLVLMLLKLSLRTGARDSIGE